MEAGLIEMPLDLLFNDWAEISLLIASYAKPIVMVTVSVTVQSFWTRIAPGCGVSLIRGNATNPGNDMDPPQCVAGSLGCPCRNARCDAGLACEGDVCVEAEPEPEPIGGMVMPPLGGEIPGPGGMPEPNLCDDFYYQVCNGDNDCVRDGYVCGPVRPRCTSSTCGCDPATGQAGVCTADCLQNARLCVREPDEPVGGVVMPPIGGMDEPNLCADWYYKTCLDDNDCERAGYVCGALIEDRCVASTCGCDEATGEAGVCTRDCLRNVGLCERAEIIEAMGGNPAVGGMPGPVAGGMPAAGGMIEVGGMPSGGGMPVAGGMSADGGMSAAGGMSVVGGQAMSGGTRRWRPESQPLVLSLVVCP